MEDFMERHGLLDTCINNGINHLPEDLQEIYLPGLSVTLGNEDQYFPSQICRDSYVLPHELYQLH